MSDTPKDPDNTTKPDDDDTVDNTPDGGGSSEADGPTTDTESETTAVEEVTASESDAAPDSSTSDAAGAEVEDAPDERAPSEQLDAALAATPLVSSGAAPAAAEPTAEPEVEHAEESSGSLAGRVLTWLILLLVGAGAALWGGPQLAPHLPSGLAPLAAWLTPGQSAVQEELATLRSDLEAAIAAVDTRVSDLPAPPSAEELTAAAVAETEARIATLGDEVTTQVGGVSDAISGLQGTVDASMANVAAASGALSDRVAAIENAEFGQRQSQIETRLAGIEGTIDQITAFEPVEGLPEGTLEELTQFQSAVAGLRAEIDALATADADLAERFEGVVATTEREIAEARSAFLAEVETARAALSAEVEAARAAVAEAEEDVAAAEEQVAVADERAAEAERLAAISASVEAIGAAITQGTPFAAPLSVISGSSDAAVPEILSANAEAGVATLTALKAQFNDVAYDAIRGELGPGEEGNVLGRAGAFLSAQFATRSLTPQDGDGTDAVLSRADAALGGDDLAGAVSELATLSGAAAEALAPWIAAAEARLGAADALATLSAAALGTN